VIKLDWTIFLQFANFFILLALLHFILYRPLQGILARRRESIDGAHQRAKDLDGQINEKMARYQAQLEDAKHRGHQERLKLRQEALEQEGSTLAAAREEAGAKVQELRTRVAAETAAARGALRGETERLAGEIAAKVLGRSI
jgi:F-type H+-transporting ATPase subunit b